MSLPTSPLPFKLNRDIFPDPSMEQPEGLVAMSKELTIDMLYESYSFGIFPWPHEGYDNLWFCPNERGILEFNDLHISKSLKKQIKSHSFKTTVNQDFNQVISNCAHIKRKGQSGTWITPEIIAVYNEFHKRSYAHSVECWQEDQLVGGIYGVYMAGLFSAESMFYKKAGASKIVLLELIHQLKLLGHTWMDIQMVTPLLESMGGKLIKKSEFLTRLNHLKSRYSMEK